MELDADSGTRLLNFVRRRMSMSSYYQPLVIRSLIEAGGRMPTVELATRLLEEDRFAVAKALRILMRWPRATLCKHGIVEYDREHREFVLLAEFETDAQREAAVAECTSAILAWQQ